jgi:hypothetical protein
MQALGFSLREIRELGNLRARSVDACESAKKLLSSKLAEVRTKVREFGRLESELAADLRKCNAELKRRRQHAPAACPVLGWQGQGAPCNCCLNNFGDGFEVCRWATSG